MSAFDIGEVISTPYGDVKVVQIRSATEDRRLTVIGTPTRWQLAEYSQSQPVFYLNPKDCKKKPPARKVGDLITCQYGGAGVIKEVRDLHYVVELSNWKLAQGQSPILYLMHSAVKLDDRKKAVSASIQSQKAAPAPAATPTPTPPAQAPKAASAAAAGSAPIAAEKPAPLKNASIPKPSLLNIGDRITCSYGGAGVIKEVRDLHYVVHLNNWQLAQGQSPILYLMHSAVKLDDGKSAGIPKSPLLAAGDLITCPYGGAGVIKEVRDLHYVVQLSNWKLAQGQSPILYLMHSAVKRDDARMKAEQEEQQRQAEWRALLNKAVGSKEEAAAHFKNKNFDGAKGCYLAALAALNSMGTTLPENLRAEILEHTIPCHNNIALCCMKSAKYEESRAYANNVVMLVEAMEQQILNGAGRAQGNGDKDRAVSMVWIEFKKRGMTFTKLIKDWKKKSLFYIGKAAHLQHEYDAAIEYLSLALAVLVTPLEGSVAYALATCDGSTEEVQKLVNDSVYLTSETKSNGDLVMSAPSAAQNDPQYQQNIKELTDLLQQAKADKKKQEKKEQATWSKAFQKSAEEEAAAKLSADTQQQQGKSTQSPLKINASGSSKGSASSSKGAAESPQSPRSVNAVPPSPKGGAAAAVASKKAADAEDDDDDDDDDEEEEGGGSLLKSPAVWGLGGLGVLAAIGIGWMLSRKGNR